MKKYNVIYADPPWTYDNKKTGGNMQSGAEDHYTLMSNNDIANMPIKQLCQKDAILFMWATVPLMPEALKVIEGWGFQYKTMLTWRKIMSQGLGYWFRGQCEHLLVATKGSPKAFRHAIIANQIALNYNEAIKYTPFYKQKLKMKMNQLLPELIRAEADYDEFWDALLKETQEVTEAFDEFVKTISSVPIWDCRNVSAIIKAYQKDPASIEGIVKKINKK